MLSQRILSPVFFATKQLKNSPLLCCLENVKNVRWATAAAADNEIVFDSAALSNAKPFKEMPTFLMLPWIGTAWIYLPIIGRYSIRRQHKDIVDKRKRMGDIFRERIGSVNIVNTFSADDMQVLFKHEGQYPLRFELTSLKAYRESRKDWYPSTGVIILQGKEWHDLRSKTQKHLMKPKAIHAYLNPMQDVSRDFVDKISTVRDYNNEVPNFLGELYKWALESVAVVGLDARLGCLDKNLTADSDGARMINAVQTQFDCMAKLEAFTGNIQFWKYFPTPTWKKFSKASDTFTEIAFRYINLSLEELKKNVENDKEMTLLQSMLMTKGLDVSGAMVMVADMLTAGIDTTSHTVGFFLYNMAKHPDKQERLYEEITKLLPRKEDRITTDVFNEMKYLKACIKESHRLYPIVNGLPRVIDHDVVLSGYRIPAGTIVAVGLHEMHKDKKYFLNSQQYLPERWLNKEEKFHPFSFVPFGIGTRSCIGRRLAELEIIILTSEIIRNFKVEYHHEDIDIYTGLINRPDRPLRFNFIER